MKSPRKQPVCWCGNQDLTAFSEDYLRCARCETLVLRRVPAGDITRVRDDATDLYGRNYYLEHLQQDFGYPDFATRARTDLPERCLHWLRTVLKYKVPPGKALELGSAHGGFVAMLRWTGFDAVGLELSPWVVDFAKRTFNAPTLFGPIEDQTVTAGSLDVIALMDVLEHLPSPLTTMKRCLRLLKKDGVLVIQTPRYPEGRTHTEMVARKDRFLEQLKAGEHLYLYSQKSVQEFLHRLGATHLAFEPAMFAHYDMFLVASQSPLSAATRAQVETALGITPGGRLIQSLLDMADQSHALREQLAFADADRAARLEVIQQQGGRVLELEGEVHRWLEETKEQSALALQLLTTRAELTQQLHASETDRAARLEVIQQQGRRVTELEGDVHRWLEETKEQAALAQQLEAARTELTRQLTEATRHIRGLQTDLEQSRAANESLTQENRAQQSTFAREKLDLLGQLDKTRSDLASAEAERKQLSAELASLRDANEVLARELQESRVENRRLAARLDAQSRALDGAVKSLDAARARIRDLDERFSEINAHPLVRVLKACRLWRW